MPNIIQAEFFHVGGEGIFSLEALLAECCERSVDDLELALRGMKDRSSIKTVVRFSDVDGSVTAFAREFERISQLHEEAFSSFVEEDGFLRRAWLGFRSRRLVGKIIRLRKRGVRLAAQRLDAVARASGEIAVELLDHSFRPARDDEIHELCEAAHKAIHVWLFIFEPNNLFADENEQVAHAV